MKGNTGKPFTHREICGLAEETAETLKRGMNNIAGAITSQNAVGAPDATGAFVGCLTEAVMGLTAAMVQIAEALENVAGSIDDNLNRRIIAEHHRHETGND